MKKLFIACSLLFCTATTMFALPETRISYTKETQNIVFRTVQKMVARDGWEIQFYSNGTCKWFNDDGKHMLTCRYKLSYGELYLLDENGETVYKGSYVMSRDKINLSSVTFAGRSYYRK